MVRRKFFPKLIQFCSRFLYSAVTYHTLICLLATSAIITTYFLYISKDSSSPNPKQPRFAEDNVQENSSAEHNDSSKTSVTTIITTTTINPEDLARYSFVDVNRLGINVYDLDQVYHYSNDTVIEYPSPDTHPLSNIIAVKGDPSLIMFNRIPHCYEYTVQRLFTDVSTINSFEYLASTIYTPFFYNTSSTLAIARSLLNRNISHLLYERHIYFFNFYDLHIPDHPVWINVVRDPMSRIALEYQRTRDICKQTDRCFVQKDLLDLTLDQCVLKRSPRECISAESGISRMLPFFCGMKETQRCAEENDWALNEAKLNIILYYTAVGFTEDFYKFLYVLERTLPKCFKLSRLVFMNQWDPHALHDERDVEVPDPTEKTKQILRPLLHFEYELYNFIRDRLLEQYKLLVEMDS